MSRQPITARDIPFQSSKSSRPNVFTVEADGRYVLTVPDLAMVFDLDRIRHDRGELRGELIVRCDLMGTLATDGVLTSGSFNLSYVNARRDHAKWIASRARISGEEAEDVNAALDELCNRVAAAERAGKPAMMLHSFPKATADAVHDIDGLVLPQGHPSILFGDGGTGKSYLALMVLGMLARQGHKVLYADWELDGRDHRDRLERIFGDNLPPIHYVRCDRPLVAEADRIRRIVAQEGITYAVFDSIAFACDGPPESAESAAGYFRALRQIGSIGSLHLAHVTKPGNDPNKADRTEHKPFGSVFWHNGARSCWFIKRADPTEDADGRVVVGLYHRKANLGALRQPVGFELRFTDTHTTISNTPLEDVAELAKSLPLWKRMKAALSHGPMSAEALAEEIEGKEDSVRKAAKRMDGLFTVVKNSEGRQVIALVSRRAA